MEVSCSLGPQVSVTVCFGFADNLVVSFDLAALVAYVEGPRRNFVGEATALSVVIQGLVVD